MILVYLVCLLIDPSEALGHPGMNLKDCSISVIYAGPWIFRVLFLVLLILLTNYYNDNVDNDYTNGMIITL